MTILRKLKDDKFNGHHPNGIEEGMEWFSKDDNHSKPVLNERFHFGTPKDHPRNHLFTSTVIEILNDGIFKTNNSTYQIMQENE